MMTPTEFAHLLEYVNEKHGWQDMWTNHTEGRKVIKYVTGTFDTRDGKVWCVKINFHDISGFKAPEEDSVSFQEEECNEENIMQWLADNGVKKGKENPVNQ